MTKTAKEYVVSYYPPGSAKRCFLREETAFATHWTFKREEAAMLSLAEAKAVQGRDKRARREPA